MSVKCEKCGREMDRILVDTFFHDGNDGFTPHLFDFAEMDDLESDMVAITAAPNWVGADGGLSEEEFAETIKCPHCGKFPFKCEEVHANQVIELVCFPQKGGEE